MPDDVTGWEAVYNVLRKMIPGLPEKPEAAASCSTQRRRS